MADRLRVLIVEDDADGREPLAEVLSADGYEVAGAANGATGIAQLDECDVLVLDLGLPDLDGLEIIRTAARCQTRPSWSFSRATIV